MDARVSVTASRSVAVLLVAATVCLAGCAGKFQSSASTSSQTTSTGNSPVGSSQATSTGGSFANFGDVLKGMVATQETASPSALGGDGAVGGTANTKPMIFYGSDAAGRVISTGQAPLTAAPTQPGLRPVAYVDAGVSGAEEGKFQVTFENADINAVARAILGDSLKTNYSIDPRVHGTISMSAQRPVSRNQLLLMLEAALRSQGAVLVHQGGVFRILQASDANGAGDTNVGPDAGSPGFGITALPLENISAEALNKILEGFGAAPGTVRVDAARNLLIVRGTTSERQWLIDTALAFDVDWMRNQSVGIFPVKNGSPEVIISELNQLADPSSVKFQPVSRLNAVLAVSRSKEAIHQVSTWIARLDRQNDYGPRVHVYRLKSADAQKVVAVLKELFVSGAAQTESAASSPGGPTPIARGPGGAAPPPAGAATAKPETAPPGGRLAEAGGAFGGENATTHVRITADVAGNAVIVYADQQDYHPIERAIIDLDHSVSEVAIEAIAAQVTLNDTLNYGVQYFLQGAINFNGSVVPTAVSQLPAGVTAPVSTSTSSTVPAATSVMPLLSPAAPGASLLLGALTNPSVVISALRDVTDVKVLSAPSLVVADNQPALLQVGNQVPVTTGTATSTVTTQSAIVNSVSYVDTGVILRVTPHISRTSEVRLEIEQEVSSVAQNANAQTLTPTISQQKIKSTVMIDSGQTVLLAGLISEQRSQEKTGIPGVIDIPLLGNLASTSQNGSTRSELIIFIKPQIVRNKFDAQRVAQELRRRMPGFNNW